MVCEVVGCQHEGQVCGMCGKVACGVHGHRVSARDETTGNDVLGWICNNCSDEIGDAVSPYLPH